MIDEADSKSRAEAHLGQVTVLLVDRSALFREGLKQLLAGSRFHVGLEFSSLAEAARHAEGASQPALILSEVDGSSESFEDLNKLRESHSDAKLVVLTNKLVPQFLAQSLEAGADGYLIKDISLEALTQSLDLVMVGEKVFPTQLAGLLIQGKARPERPFIRPSMRPNGLSEREEAILRCLVYGYPNKVIADQLQMTEASVKVHLKALLRKIHAANRTQAAIWAINNGFQTEQAIEQF
jgi:two-component system nitrate/nitrite response regulator NarL